MHNAKVNWVPHDAQAHFTQQASKTHLHVSVCGGQFLIPSAKKCAQFSQVIMKFHALFHVLLHAFSCTPATCVPSQ